MSATRGQVKSEDSRASEVYELPLSGCRDAATPYCRYVPFMPSYDDRGITGKLRRTLGRICHRHTPASNCVQSLSLSVCPAQQVRASHRGRYAEMKESSYRSSPRHQRYMNIVQNCIVYSYISYNSLHYLHVPCLTKTGTVTVTCVPRTLRFKTTTTYEDKNFQKYTFLLDSIYSLKNNAE